MKTIILFTLLILLFLFLQVDVRAQLVERQKDEHFFAGVKISKIFDDNYHPSQASENVDTIYSFNSPGTFPTGLTWDGQYLWNCDEDLWKIYKLTTNGNVISSFPAPYAQSLGDLEWDGNYLWLTSEQSAILFKIDTSTGTPVEQFHLPSYGKPDPNGFGLAWDGQFLWHSEYGDSARIYKLDPLNGQVISSFVPPKKLILGITWVEGYLYGINIEWNLGGGIIYRFDPSSGGVLDSMFWDIPHPLGLDWDGNNFWNVSGTSIYKASNDITSIDFKNSNILSDYFLYQNYPNPFNPVTKIKFTIPSVGTSDRVSVQIVVYDVLGNEIATLVNEEKPIGEYEVEFNGSNLPSGIYFYQIKAGSFTQTKKMVLLK